ncbi:MAG TPA: hypothetical protein VKQ11_03725 [Candidatus Sulfotelmatobacter sp.]|nr:hypothetical protein [Candidatus Sulfotelmatobacter sp.]
MPQFSRRTVLAAVDTILNRTHAEIDRFALEYGLERTVVGYSKADKANALGAHLVANPDATTDDGENLTDAVVTALVDHAIRRSRAGYPPQFSLDEFRRGFPLLSRGLERDGFTAEGGALRRTLPGALDLPRADDQIHQLLDHYGFAVTRGHLDQGIAAHSRGDWAAANAQFRAFIESMLDSIADRLAAGAALPDPGHERRQWLANRNPPFFSAELHEWNAQGSGFIQGFFRRLHPAGAHPGLSDEEDSTFRLHLVLLTARLLLRRLN